MYLSFQNPLYLYFLLLIPIIVVIHFFNYKFLRSESLKFANFEAIGRVKGIDVYSRNHSAIILNVLMFSLIIFLISGLTLIKEVESSLFSFVIAVDSSQSMGATDIDPNRLESAKRGSISFIESLPEESKIGIVSFAGNTYIENELTTDKKELKKSINEINIIEFGGTDVFEAISISINLLEGQENKAVILFSDGQVNIGDINEVIELARQSRIVINTIGVGTSEGGLTNYGISQLDEDTLKKIAENTDGTFFKVGSNKEMEDVFKQLAPSTSRTSATDLSKYLIIIIIVLFILGPIISRREKII